MKMRKRLTSFNRSVRGAKKGTWLRIGVGVLLVYVALDLLMLPRGDEFLVKNPISTALIEARRDEAAARGAPFAPAQRWVALKHLPPSLSKAILVSEDASFSDHSGFDFSEIGNAVTTALKTASFPRGASTISQQLAKNLYLTESRSPLRKLREAVLTLKLERSLSKARILEIYLNIIELGPQIFGVEAASQKYFGISARDLNESQSAFLAAIIPNPRTVFNPKLHPERVRKRTSSILRRMQRSKLTGVP
jgi:monofunctional biosynthetic peptidoglycan transglycosylase